MKKDKDFWDHIPYNMHGRTINCRCSFPLIVKDMPDAYYVPGMISDRRKFSYYVIIGSMVGLLPALFTLLIILLKGLLL